MATEKTSPPRSFHGDEKKGGRHRKGGGTISFQLPMFLHCRRNEHSSSWGPGINCRTLHLIVIKKKSLVNYFENNFGNCFFFNRKV